MTLLFAVTALFWAGGVILHCLFTRCISNANFIRNGYIFLIATGMALTVYTIQTNLLSALFMYLNLAILWNLYTVFFINMTNSVSLRIMIELDDAPGQTLSTAQLLGVYSDEEALQSRLAGLVATGFLQSMDGDYALTEKGVTFAKILVVIRKLIGIEFYG